MSFWWKIYLQVCYDFPVTTNIVRNHATFHLTYLEITLMKGWHRIFTSMLFYNAKWLVVSVPLLWEHYQNYSAFWHSMAESSIQIWKLRIFYESTKISGATKYFVKSLLWLDEKLDMINIQVCNSFIHYWLWTNKCFQKHFTYRVLQLKVIEHE